MLIVNVASSCGLTPQYKGLETLHEKYADKGLAILGFPANEFAAQEPGTDTEISEFCTTKYGVKFDMFSKVVVKGDGQCPLYKFLTSSETDPKFPGDIKWNFEKFLIDRDGNIVNRLPQGHAGIVRSRAGDRSGIGEVANWPRTPGTFRWHRESSCLPGRGTQLGTQPQKTYRAARPWKSWSGRPVFSGGIYAAGVRVW